jgi:STE24 endopeptidase
MNYLVFRVFLMALFALRIVVTTCLSFLNISHTFKNSRQLPPELTDIVTLEQLAASTAYNFEKLRFQTVHFLFHNLLLFCLLFTPLFFEYTRWIDALPLPYVLRGLLFFAILSSIFWLFDQPWEYYFHFRIENRYGFNKYTLLGWLFDSLKSLLVVLLLEIVTLCIVFSVWNDDFTFRWLDVLGGWLVSTILVIIFMYLVPVVLIPIFYRLHPLAEGELKTRIAALVEQSGFRMGGIFIAEQSNKSTHANAAFSGIGQTKTIILFDTLLANYTPDEILAVLAHEIGHGKHRHVIKFMVITLCEIFIFILSASYLLATDLLYQTFGIADIFYSGAFLAYFFFFEICAFYFQPFVMSFSRRMEYQADNYSRQIIASGDPLISTFQKFISSELQIAEPHPWYEAFNYSHPCLIKRIRALQNLHRT